MNETTMAASDEWPAEDLETLNRCPVCGSPQRTLRYDDLEDWSFRAAPGKWSLWTCGGCNVDYLDPRPTPTSIGRAYATYYTHAPGDEAAPAAGPSWTQRLYRRLKEPLRNGYLWREYGHDLHPRCSLGEYLFARAPYRRLGLDLQIRHLPPPSHPGARLLDIGCGDGSFLLEAQRLGYQAEGIDPDIQAVNGARQRSLTIHHGGFPTIDLPSSSFEQITLSHVIEHVHAPIAALAEVRRLLTQDGRLWLATPDITGATHQLFKKHWRGLEAPRHLCLFSQETMASALRLAGYREITAHLHQPSAEFFIAQSLRQKEGKPPNQGQQDHLAPIWLKQASAINKSQGAAQSPSDILIVTAKK